MNSSLSRSASDSGTNTGVVIAVIADALWILAYIFAIWTGFRDHSYGIPLVAICLNFSWEFVFSFIIRPQSKLRLAINLIWLALDCVIVYQLLRWGRTDQLPQIQPYFVPIVFGTMILAGIGFVTFRFTFDDPDGENAAFAINLVMSILFLFLLFSRSGSHGLSYATAWLKMLGTLILSILNIIFKYKQLKENGFFVFLYASIFLFDVIYIYLITLARG